MSYIRELSVYSERLNFILFDSDPQATLHEKGTCSYCWGEKSNVFPKGALLRYYPCDPGYSGIRNAVSLAKKKIFLR